MSSELAGKVVPATGIGRGLGALRAGETIEVNGGPGLFWAGVVTAVTGLGRRQASQATTARSHGS